jgi:hypothetical protein
MVTVLLPSMAMTGKDNTFQNQIAVADGSRASLTIQEKKVATR